MDKTEELLELIRQNPALFETALKIVFELAQSLEAPQSEQKTGK